jgi:hypothetical protein
MRAAMGLTQRIARELRERGTYSSRLEGAMSYSEANRLFELSRGYFRRGRFRFARGNPGVRRGQLDSGPLACKMGGAGNGRVSAPVMSNRVSTLPCGRAFEVRYLARIAGLTQLGLRIRRCSRKG